MTKLARMLLISLFFTIHIAEAVQPPSIYQTMQQLRARDKLNQAITLGETYLNTHPKDVDVMLLIGLMLYQKQDYANAAARLQHVLTLSPQYLDAKIALIRVEFAQHHLGEANRLLKDVIKQAPHHPDVIVIQAFVNQTQATSQPKSKKRISQLPTIPTLATALPASPLHELQRLRAKGHLNTAIRIGKAYLIKNPQDADVMLLIGLMYYQQHQWQLAKAYCLSTLSIAPHYIDAKIALVRINIAMQDHAQAAALLQKIAQEAPQHPDLKTLYTMLKKAKNEKTLALIDRERKADHDEIARRLIQQALQRDPTDLDILAKQASFYVDQHQYALAAHIDKNVLSRDPTQQEAKGSLQEIYTLNPHFLYGLNEAGLNNEVDYVSDLHQVWQYSTLYYSRNMEKGQMVLGLNNASRFKTNASQGSLNLFPVINRHMYLNITAAYADEPLLFPTYVGGLQSYLSGKLLELSGGFIYSAILPQIAYSQYTGAVSKEWGDFWISFRPIYYVPMHGPRSLLYTTTLIKYIGTKDTYAKVVIGSGTSPNLANLKTVDFLFIHNNFVTLGVQLPLMNHQLLFNIGGDYQHWVFPNTTRTRNIAGITFGLNYRFEDLT